MICINIINFELIDQLEEYHSLTEKRRLKSVVIFIQETKYFTRK